ncbi:MAG TPA: multicopper oxidase domain-containing protein, partial [Actinomycetota bacterium]
AAAPAAATGSPDLEIEIGELFLDPEELSAQPGSLSITVRNTGSVEHNLAIDGVGATPMIPPGGTATLEADDIAAGEYEMICEVPGHADGGMRGTLLVGEAGTGEHDGMAAMTPEEMVAHDAERTGSFPAETEGRGGQPLEPEVLPNGTKVFELTAEAIRWEVEPGKVFDAFAYNGQVPGPELRAELGDRVRIILHNELPQPTTLHLHGMIVPNDMDGVPVINQDAIMPGESFTYEFRVRNTGSNMYHSHFNAQEQVPMGLLGAFIVPDPADPEVDVDATMILNDGPLGFSINGKGFPATEPVVASEGDLIRIRYMNEGLQVHPMHLHGMPQEVVALDGHILRRPYMMDTVLVAPGQRVDVLVRATEPGPWAFHCHVLTHAEGPDGMFGMVTALIVD